MTMHESSPLSVRVDVRLCGGIPRKDMKLEQHEENQGARCLSRLATLSHANGLVCENPTLSKNSSIDRICDGLNGILSIHCPSLGPLHTQPSHNLKQENCPLAPVMEPPSWAVPARGESILEPVCESMGRQSAIDLTGRSSFRIGRSPNCDVQLFHATSSRRHAMLFHHSNGSCYVVDCGSAHGTFVNGVRVVSSTVNGGVVVPHKIRRGAMVRFGGPGAPTYVLKSFSFKLPELSESIDCDGSDSGELVRRNTRLNALGKTASEKVHANWMSNQLSNVVRKRSFDSLASEATLELDDDSLPSTKRVRCSSPPLELEILPRLVSPDLPAMLASKPRRVCFSPAPPQCFYPASVTPDDLSAEEDNDDASV